MNTILNTLMNRRDKVAEKYKMRKDGRYSARVRTGLYTDDGKPVTKDIYAKTSKELEKMVAEINYEIDHGIYANDKNLTFGEYAQKWLKVAKDSKEINTKAMYDKIIRLHIDLLEHKKLSAITKSDIQLQINQRKDKPRTCEQMHITIHQVLEQAVDDGLINKNPCRNIDLPKYKPEEKRALTKAEKTAVAKANLTDLEKAYIYLLYGCGLRPEELFALERKDIDYINKEVSINKALTFDKNYPVLKCEKSDAGKRTIQAPDFVIEALKDYTKSNICPILFHNENGEYMTRSAYYNIFTRIVRRMKEAVVVEKSDQKSFDGLCMYIFRHNYCTELYYAGVSLKKAQQLMGHSDYTMIMKIYAHLDEEKEKTTSKIAQIRLEG